jgi:hypothetical protein
VRTRWDFDRVGFPENEAFDDFEQCVVLHACGGPCGWGKNWGCRWNYSWRAPRDPSHLPYALELRTSNTSSGHVARVAACPAGGCGGPIDEATSDAWGQVELDVGSAVGALGFIRLDFGEQVVAAYGPPVFRETSEVMAALVKVRPEYAVLGGPDFPKAFADPASAMLGLKALDCAAAPALGVSFELVGDTGGQPFVFASGFPTFAPETTTDASGFGGFAGLPEGTVGIRVRGSGGERLASRDRVDVTAGQVTMVALFPDITEGD